MCTWSHDPRRVFAELGRARVLSQLGEYYLKGKTTMPGHTPVQSPGDEPVRSGKPLKALLPGPLKVLSLSANGDLTISDEVTLFRECPVKLSSKSFGQLAAWRAEFPSTADPAPPAKQPGTEPESALALGSGGNDSGGSPGSLDVSMAAGTKYATVEEVGTRS